MQAVSYTERQNSAPEGNSHGTHDHSLTLQQHVGASQSVAAAAAVATKYGAACAGLPCAPSLQTHVGAHDVGTHALVWLHYDQCTLAQRRHVTDEPTHARAPEPAHSSLAR
jgi:hypothetical protein